MTIFRERIFFWSIAGIFLFARLGRHIITDPYIGDIAFVLLDICIAIVYLFFLKRHLDGLSGINDKLQTVDVQLKKPSSLYRIWATDMIVVIIVGMIGCGLNLLINYYSQRTLIWEAAILQGGYMVGAFTLMRWFMRLQRLGKAPTMAKAGI